MAVRGKSQANKRLLVAHMRIEQNARAIGKLQI
jgi:hypothetical protein